MRTILGLLLGAAVGVVVALSLAVRPDPAELAAAPATPSSRPDAGAPPAVAPPGPAPAPPPEVPGRPDPIARCRPLRADWVEVLAPRCHLLAAVPADRARDLAARCDGVLAWLEDTWGAGPRRRVALVVAPDRAAFGEVFRALDIAWDPGWALGVYATAWDCIVAFEHEDVASTLLHESFHAYVRGRTKGEIPTWWNEGYASYFGTAEWKGHAVRFRDHHHAAFWGLRGAVLAGRWIPLAELVALPPARFYDRAVAPVAYLESYALVFALEHLLAETERAPLSMVREAVLGGGDVAVAPGGTARAEAALLELILGADLPEVPDLAARLRTLVPEAGDDDAWRALASAAAGPAGAGVETLPTGEAALALRDALLSRLRAALTGADAGAAAFAAVALLDLGDARSALRHAPADVLGRLDWRPPLPLADLAHALEVRVAAWKPGRGDRFPPPCQGELAALAELAWQLQRAWDEPGAGAEALRERLVAELLLPDPVLFWAGMSRWPRAVARPWADWARMLEGRAADPVSGTTAVDAARTLGRLARAGNERSIEDALALRLPRPDARAALLAELAGGARDDRVGPLLNALVRDTGIQAVPAAVYGLLRLREPPADAVVGAHAGRGGIGDRIVLDRIALTHPHLGVAVVENALADRDPAMRALALRALGWYPGDKTSTLLLRALRERRGAEQCAAAGAVLRLLID